jgi:hypothetical protein
VGARALSIAAVALAASACLDHRPLIVPRGDYSTLDLEAGSPSPTAFSRPSALALVQDGDGVTSLYFSEGHRIMQMKVDSGLVSTVAGGEDGAASKDGTGTEARFGAIIDLTSDRSRLLFVADGCAIRKVDVTTREVTTLTSSVDDLCGSGIGAAVGISHVSYCETDRALYVSDGPALRRVDVATGVLAAVHGTDGQAWAPTGGDAGPATCAGDTLFVADGRFVDQAAMGTWRWGDSLTGLFSSGARITSLVSDPTYLYVLEGATIWRVRPDTGDAVTCELVRDGGDGPAAPHRCPTALVRGVPGPFTEVFLTDACTHSLRALNCETHLETTLVPTSASEAVDGAGEDARFTWPAGVASDGVGNAFVVDGRSVRKVSATTHEVSTVATDVLAAAPSITWPIGIVSDGERYLYVADPSEYTIRRVDTSTGEVSRVVGTQHQGVSEARITGLAIDRVRQKLYFTDVGDGTIRSVAIGVDLADQVTLVAGQRYSFGTADGLPLMSKWVYPTGLAFDGRRILVADAGAATIRAIDLEANAVSTIAGIGGVPGTADGDGAHARFMEPVSVALDVNGNLIVVDRLAGTVRRLEMANGAVTSVTTILGASAAPGSPLPEPATKLGPTPGQLYLPQALAVSPSNELLLIVPNALLVAR